MDERYERFNEITFEAYCKAAIDKGVLKERQRKAKRAEKEVLFSALSDRDIDAIPIEDEVVECIDNEKVFFTIDGQAIMIRNLRIGQAISFLLPRDREIIILFYFAGKNEAEIAERFRVDRTTINRRRRAAEQKLRKLLEDER